MPTVCNAAGQANGLAIGSLVASAVGVLCGVGSLVGIVLGIVALNQIKTNGEGGAVAAIASIAVGAATLLLNVVFRPRDAEHLTP